MFTELCDLIGEAAADRIISLFRVDLKARFIDIDSRDALRRDAHAIKSTAGMLGFDELSAAAAILEANCESGHELTRSLGELMIARCRVDQAVVAFGALAREPGLSQPPAAG